jgi:hypothetical protein
MQFRPQRTPEALGQIVRTLRAPILAIRYLKHLEQRGPENEPCEGMLLYPTVSHPVDFVFETQGHVVRVVTLDLRREGKPARSLEALGAARSAS